MVEVLGVRWVHALCPEVIARFLDLAAGGGVGARTEALDGGRGGTFWYWNGMLTACAGEERERTLPPAGKARAGHGTLTSFLAAAAAVFVADVVGRGGKGLET